MSILSAKVSLWVQWIHKYLIRKGSFWSAQESSSLGSWMWKKLLKQRPMAASLNRIEIQSGTSASFWYDDWSSLGRLVDVVGSGECIAMGIHKNDTVERVVQAHRRRIHRTDVLNKIEEEIHKLRTKGFTSDDDISLWKYNDNTYLPKFSTAQTWRITRTAYPTVPWYKSVWFAKATPKYSVLTWLAVHDRLATGERMKNWTAGIDATCPLCHEPNESRSHLFFQCSYSETIWRGLVARLLGSDYTARWENILEYLQKSIGDKTTLFLVRYAFQITVHSVWRERNRRKHGETPTSPTLLGKLIEKQIRNKLSVIRRENNKKFEGAMVIWFASRVSNL